MNKFKYKAYVPSIDMYVDLPEFKLADYIHLIKYIANNDTELIIDAFESIIKNMVSTEMYTRLTRVDKFFILCTIRAISIGPVVSLTFEDEKSNKQYTSKVELIKTLQNIDSKEFQYRQQVDVSDNIQLSITTPTSIGSHTETDLLLDCIHSLSIDGTEYYMNDLPPHEKHNIIDTLPSTIVANLSEYISKTCEVFAGVNLFKRMNPHTKPPEIDEYAVNFYDNSMLDFLMVCYRDSLQNIYEMIYVLCKTLNFTGEFVHQSTYSELTMYIDLYQKELEAQEKAERDAARQSSSPGSIGNPIQQFG